MVVTFTVHVLLELKKFLKKRKMAFLLSTLCNTILNFRQKCHIESEDFFKFCGLLRIYINFIGTLRDSMNILWVTTYFKLTLKVS